MVKLQKYSIIENFDGAVYNPLLTYRPPEITYGNLTNNDPTDDILAYNDTNITSRTMTNNPILNTNVLNNSNIIANNSSLLSPVSTYNPILNPNNDLSYLSYISSNTSNRYGVSSNVLPNVSLNTSNNTSNILSSVSLNTSNISSGVSTNKTFNVFDKKDNNLYRLTQILIGFSILFIVIFLIYVIYMLFFHKEESNGDYINSQYNYLNDDFNSKKSIKYVPRNTSSFIKQTPYIPIIKDTGDNLTKIPIEKEVIASDASDANSNGFLSRFFGFDKTTSSMEPVSKQSSSLKDELPSELYLKNTVVVDNSPLINKTPEKGFLNRFFGTSPPTKKPLNN